LSLAACGKVSSETGEIEPSSPSLDPGAPPAQAALIRLSDPSQVCMINNQYMGKPQIPVVVGGKTYFGCCAMCKQKLETDPSARTATDPVSGQPVDKASAVIARNADNKVFYFESEGTLRRYRQ
jgi:YHS domain-containing protein